METTGSRICCVSGRVPGRVSVHEGLGSPHGSVTVLFSHCSRSVLALFSYTVLSRCSLNVLTLFSHFSLTLFSHCSLLFSHCLHTVASLLFTYNLFSSLLSALSLFSQVALGFLCLLPVLALARVMKNGGGKRFVVHPTLIPTSFYK